MPNSMRIAAPIVEIANDYTGFKKPTLNRTACPKWCDGAMIAAHLTFAFWAGAIKSRCNITIRERWPCNTPNSEKLITLIGGSGFVGRHIVRSLAKRGYRIRVACRRPDLAGHVVPLGVPGQIALVQANVRYPASVAAACEGAYAVINLAAVFHNGRAQSYQGVHVFGAEAVAKAAKAAKAQVLIHLSGIGADAEQRQSLYGLAR